PKSGLASWRVYRLDNQSMKNPASGSIHELHEMHMSFHIGLVILGCWVLT
ncbi:hypothetical protein COCCADRAFT_98273, partial [Bipolaris zeicola 26-R-13]